MIRRRSAPSLAGDCEVQVEVASSLAPWGEAVEGALLVRASSAQEVREARAELLTLAPQADPAVRHQSVISATTSTKLEVAHWGRFSIEWRGSLRLPFRLEMPYGVPLDADAQVRGGLVLMTGERATVAVNLEVNPPGCFKEAAGHFARLSGSRMGTWRRTGSHECRMDFLATSGWLTGRRYRMRISQADGIVSGEVTVAASALAIRSLRERAHFGFRFTCPADAPGSLLEELERGFRAIETGTAALPVPAAAPVEDPANLPLPANGDASGIGSR